MRPIRRTIAVIDQDADSRLIARAVLGGEYAIAEFESAEQAAIGLAMVQPDLIVLDVALPGRDGLFVVEWLRTAPNLKHVPVVAFSAVARPDCEKHFVRAGFSACVGKPLSDERLLLEPVRRLIPAHRLTINS